MLWLLVLATAAGVMLARRHRAPAALIASFAVALVALVTFVTTGHDLVAAALRAAAAAAVVQAGDVAGLFIWDTPRRPDKRNSQGGRDGAA